MKQRLIPVEESLKQWKKDPRYVAAYDALEAEFSLASALIKARADADMTQEQVAQAMGTTQAVVARLESGKVLPSTRTLERFAKATRQHSSHPAPGACKTPQPSQSPAHPHDLKESRRRPRSKLPVLPEERKTLLH